MRGYEAIVEALDAPEARLLAPLPPAFPATLTVTHVVSSQALVAFRGNSYSVPPGFAGGTLTLTHRLGEQTLDVATASGTVLARHRREPDGAGVLVRDTVRVTALAPFTTGKPCHRKAREPPSVAALIEAEHRTNNRTHAPDRDDVVVDLQRYATAAQDRRVAP